MTLEQLSHFLAAAKYLNFTRAAEELYVHQTSVSRSVAAIEQELDVVLFARDGRSLRLTDAGAYLYQEGLRILDHFQSMQQETKKIHQGVSGKLNIVGFRFYIKTLTAYYKTFRAMYPNVQLSVTEVAENDYRKNESALLDGEADLGLIFYRHTDRPDPAIQCRKAFSDAMDVITARSHPLAARTSVSIDDLSGEMLLLAAYMDPVTGNTVNQALAERGLPPLRMQPAAQRAQAEPEWLMQVSAGFGISFMPRIAAKQSFWDLAILPMNDLDVRFDLYIAHRRDNDNPALKLFLDLLAKQPMNISNGGVSDDETGEHPELSELQRL